MEARATVDRAVATTGDVITYTLTLDHDPAYEVEIPEAGAEIAGFRILDIGGEEPREEGGRTILERWYRLRADLVGSYVLPPLTVTYRKAPEKAEGATPANAPAEDEPAPDAAGSEAQTLETSAIFVEVQSVLPADAEVTDILDIKPLREVAPVTPWKWIAVGVGAFLLLSGLGFYLWRRARNRPAPPPAPPHEVAFAALGALRGTNFGDPEAVRRFHFQISEVLRTYVEGRFGLNATDLTTEEILPQLRQLPRLADAPREAAERFLTATDRVKFAAHEPGEAEIQETYEAALGFVEATRPVETAEEAAAGEANPASGGGSGSRQEAA